MVEARERRRKPNPPMVPVSLNVPTTQHTILGIDASLTNTGVAVLSEGQMITASMKPPSAFRGAERLEWFFTEFHLINLRYDFPPPDLVVIEGYAFGAKMQREAMGELGGVLRLAMRLDNRRFIIVQPTSLKLFITGKGAGPKDNMSKEIYKRYGVDLTDNNQVDAAGLAIMGLATLTDMPVTEFQKRALSKIE